MSAEPPSQAPRNTHFTAEGGAGDMRSIQKANVPAPNPPIQSDG